MEAMRARYHLDNNNNNIILLTFKGVKKRYIDAHQAIGARDVLVRRVDFLKYKYL